MTYDAIGDTLGAFCRDTHVALDGAPEGPLGGAGFRREGPLRHCRSPHRLRQSGLVGEPPAGRHHGPPTVTALLAAGARLVGKTVTDELAFSLNGENHFYGTPRNPNAPGRIPGGSSSGSASAVAGGLVDFALGTDTGGSVRAPASYCGIWGIRTTHGAITLDGIMPLAPSFDTGGLVRARPGPDGAGRRHPAAAGIGGGADPRPAGRGRVRGGGRAGAGAPARGGGADGVRAGGRTEAGAAQRERPRRMASPLLDPAVAGDLGNPPRLDPVGPARLRPEHRRAVRRGGGGDRQGGRRGETVSGRTWRRCWRACCRRARPWSSRPFQASRRRSACRRTRSSRAGTAPCACCAWPDWGGCRSFSMPVVKSAEGLPLGLSLIGGRGTDRGLLAAGRAVGAAG